MSNNNILTELFEECLEQEYQTEENGADWAYRRENARLTVFFQHSHGLIDWLNNMDFASAPYKDMTPRWRCHSGFLRAWKSLMPRLEGLLLDPNIEDIRIVGYSHGAALAVLCHEYCWFRREDLREKLLGLGYGCPRVLYGCVPPELAQRWERFYVIRNIEDIVTHLPPRGFGYCHVGNLVEIGKTGRYSAIDAHRPEHYLAELKALDNQS